MIRKLFPLLYKCLTCWCIILFCIFYIFRIILRSDNPYLTPYRMILFKFSSSVPCVTEMNDFISSFLFSIETQTTIGYGTRTPNTEYPEALFLISVQSIFGMLLQSIVIGVVYAKLSRPKTRGASVIFRYA